MTHLASHTARKHDPLQLFSRALGTSRYYRLPLTFSVSLSFSLSPLAPRERTPRFLVRSLVRCTRAYTRVLAENNGAFSVFLEPPRKSSAPMPFSCFSFPSLPPPSLSPSSLLHSPSSLHLQILLHFSPALFISQPLQLLKPCRVTLRWYITEMSRWICVCRIYRRNRIKSSPSLGLLLRIVLNLVLSLVVLRLI